MARIRSMKPELRTSLVVASWPREVRYFWALLWGYLDDHGRGVDDPRLVKADCFPLDDDLTSVEMADWLNLIASAGPLCRYQSSGKRYMHAPSWWEHQRPSHPGKSRIPPCPIHDHPDGPPETLARPSGDPPETLAPEQVVRAGSREQATREAEVPETDSATLRERRNRQIVRSSTNCSEDEAATIVARVQKERNPRSLGGLLRTMAEAGDLHAMLDGIRATARKTRVAAELAELKKGPACEHGQRGGASPHPLGNEPICPQCRQRGRLGQLNATRRPA